MTVPGKVRILATTQRSLFSKLIRFGTWSKYSHVDIILGDGQHVIGATALEGVRVEYVHEMKRKSSAWAIYEFDCKLDRELQQLAISQLGKGYDYLAIIGFIFRKKWQKETRWFCSELVAWVAEQLGCPLLTGPHHRITPGALIKSPQLKLIEEG